MIIKTIAETRKCEFCYLTMSGTYKQNQRRLRELCCKFDKSPCFKDQKVNKFIVFNYCLVNNIFTFFCTKSININFVHPEYDITSFDLKKQTEIMSVKNICYINIISTFQHIYLLNIEFITVMKC